LLLFLRFFVGDAFFNRLGGADVQIVPPEEVGYIVLQERGQQ